MTEVTQSLGVLDFKEDPGSVTGSHTATHNHPQLGLQGSSLFWPQCLSGTHRVDTYTNAGRQTNTKNPLHFKR